MSCCTRALPCPASWAWATRSPSSSPLARTAMRSLTATKSFTEKLTNEVPSFEPKVSILLVDDQPNNLLALEATLASMGQNVARGRSGFECRRCLLDHGFAVILMDVTMPGMDGFETGALIRGPARSRLARIISPS